MSLVGTIIAYFHNVLFDDDASAEWKICNGQSLSQTTYSELFGIVSFTFGTGDGDDTFSLPDLRGLFIRGLDWNSQRETTKRDPDVLSRATDPNGNPLVGSFQDLQIGPHRHDLKCWQLREAAGNSEVSGFDNSDSGDPWGATETYGPETQSQDSYPRNVYVTYLICVKAS